jgi:pantothenate kinase type III
MSSLNKYLILVDIGNTSILVGYANLLAKPYATQVVGFESSDKGLEEAIASLERLYQQKHDVDYFIDQQPTIVLSAVVPLFFAQFVKRLEPLYKIIKICDFKKKLLYRPEMEKGVEEIADDLLIGALAGNYILKKPALLIDAGTATTTRKCRSRKAMWSIPTRYVKIMVLMF